MGWYHFAAQHLEGLTVLDVGCGSGEGLKVLSARAADALGIDLDDRLERPDVAVEIKSIEDMPDKSFDVVVCLDVIEHVEHDKAFLGHLFRVARKAVFVTTPNYTMSRNRNPYHVREYTAREFARLFKPYGEVRLLAGRAKGGEILDLTRPRAYFLVNDLYTWRPTVLVAKVLKRLLRVKVWAHQAAWVEIDSHSEAADTARAARGKAA